MWASSNSAGSMGCLRPAPSPRPNSEAMPWLIGPDVQRHHEGRGAFALRRAFEQGFHGLAHHLEGGIAGLRQVGVLAEIEAHLEHGGIIGRFAAGEVEIGAPEPVEGNERIGFCVVPGEAQRLGEGIDNLLPPHRR